MTERYKGGVHATAFGLGLVMFAYNLGEWVQHRDREHAINVGLYGLFCGWEFTRVLRHCGRAGALTLLALAVSIPADAQTIPRAALTYQRPLIANARAVWGLNAPIAILAAQVHQESSWRPDAKSAYAGGLGQFTPATADWISQKFPYELGTNQPFEPDWALRALARYDKFLFDRQSRAATLCDRWAFTLSSYNGGEGWVTKQKAATTRAGNDATRWFGHVERHRVRAAWAHDENVAYPRAILLRRQPPYRAWGPGVECDAT